MALAPNFTRPVFFAVLFAAAPRVAHGQHAPGPDHPVLESLAYAPDGRLVAAGLNGQTVLIDTARWAVRRRLTGGNGLQRVGFLPDGRLVTMGRGDTAATLWNPATGAVLQVQRGGFACATFFDAAWWCATTTRGYRVTHEYSSRRVALSSWDGAAFAPVASAQSDDSRSPDALLVTTDGRFAIGSRDGASSTETEPLHVHRDGPNGSRALVIEQVPRHVRGGYVRVWNRAGTRVCEWMGLGVGVRALATARNARGPIVAGDESGAVFVLPVDDCGPARTLGTHAAAVVAVAVAPDGATVVSGDVAGRVVAWDLATARRRRALTIAP